MSRRPTVTNAGHSAEQRRPAAAQAARGARHDRHAASSRQGPKQERTLARMASNVCVWLERHPCVSMRPSMPAEYIQ